MLATVPSATLLGLEGRYIRVEVDVASGLPGFTIVGLADTALQEARERIRGAVRKEQSIGIDSGCQVILSLSGPLRMQERQLGESEKLVSASPPTGNSSVQLGQRSFGIRLEALR